MLFVYVPLIVFFIDMFIYFGDLFKIILHLSFCINLWNIYNLHLVWEDIENHLNRIVDFFNKFMGFFSNFLSKFYKCFGHGF